MYNAMSNNLFKMDAAIKNGELSSVKECVDIVNELRISPPTPQPEHLDEKCKVS